MTAVFEALVQRLAAAGRITADDVLALRAVVYETSMVAAEAVEALARLETGAGERCPEWADLLGDALVDFAVHQQQPAGYVDGAKADWLMRTLAGDVRASGLSALARVLEAADDVPPALAAFVLAKARDVLCAKGRLEAADVALLRGVVFAGAGEANLAVSRHEAEALFDILEAVRGAFNDAGWPDLFAEAVACSLIGVSAYAPVSREDALRGEAWLSRRESLAALGANVAGDMAHGGYDLETEAKSEARELLDPDGAWDREWSAPEAKLEADAAAAAPITDEEARWLVGRLGQGRLSEPERRLLSFLKAEAGEVSPLLKPLLDAASPRPGPFEAPIDAEPPAAAEAPFPLAPANETEAVFGQRKTPAA